MLIRAIDFETTGIPTEQDAHAVCEVGWCDLNADVVDPTTGLMQAGPLGPTIGTFTKPGRPMPPEARAVHHISDAEIESGIEITDAFQRLTIGPPDYFCAHNADYERKFFNGAGIPWLCSYKIALRLWPDAPSHSLQVLRYWLALDVDQARCMPPHRAGPDAYLGAALMARIIEGGGAIEDMARWSNGPALLPKVNFGKHKGARWEDVPEDYLRWLVDKSDMDRDVKANARHHLKLRTAPAQQHPERAAS